MDGTISPFGISREWPGVSGVYGFTQALGALVNADTSAGSWADATSASDTPSRISRTLDRSAIHKGSSDSAGPV